MFEQYEDKSTIEFKFVPSLSWELTANFHTLFIVLFYCLMICKAYTNFYSAILLQILCK